MTLRDRGVAFGERLRLIAITAVFTSIGWIIFGAVVLGDGRGFAGLGGAGSTDRRSNGEPMRSEASLASTLAIPVSGIKPSQLSDTFREARGGGTRIHDAIDIMAPRGTPVVAAAAGVVEKLFASNAGGLTVYIRSPDRRTIFYYAHLDAYAPGLAEGQAIARGQAIGTVGYTGNADPAAPHLHFAIMQTTPDAAWSDPATAINPYPLLTRK